MKKLLAAVLSVCIAAGLFINAYAVDYGEELQNAPEKNYSQKFSDVPKSHWAFNYIAELAERGVINGYPDGKFYPESQVTRAEFAKIMTTAAGLTIAEPTMQIFTDVQITDWYAPYVHAAKEYLSAYNQNGSSFYMPTTPALREDIAVALVKLKGYSTTGADMTALQRMFSDYQSISESAKIYVAAAVENGLVSGYNDGTFRGQNSITRSEAAALLWRAYQYGNANKTYGNTSEKTDSTQNKNTDVTDNKNTNISSAEDKTTSTKTESEKSNVSTPEVKKPYVMKKLASANLSSSSMATMDDDGNIYYIDSSDGYVYRISVSNGSKSKYLSTKKMSYKETEEQENEVEQEVTKTVETGEYEEVEEEVTEMVVDEETGEETEVTKTVTKKVPVTKTITEKEIKTVTEEVTVAEYTSFVPMQVFYDGINDKLLLNGYYENLVEAGKSPKTGNYQFIYDITDKSYDVYSIVNDDYYRGSYGYSSHSFKYAIQTALNSDYLLLYGRKLDIEAGKCKGINMMSFNNNVSGLKYGNNLYSLCDERIYQYDFNEDKCNSITEYIQHSAFGIKDDCYYFWESDGSMFKISVRTKMTTVLDINTKSENVDFEDMGNMQNIDDKFFVIDDDTIVFYDTSMKAFRILEEN